ncbi:hypothetical protein Tco_0066034 [Tanacetum coccineum]
MFKPTNLKDATSLARMRDEQLNQLSPITHASSVRPIKNTTMKRLTWDEMQKKRAQGLCFICVEKLSVGYKCKGPQLRVMESALDEGDYESFDAVGQLQDGIAEMKIDFADKFQHLEDIMMKLSDAVLLGKGGDNYKQVGRLMFYSKLTKLEFPTYRGDEDPIEWVKQTNGGGGYDFNEALSKVQKKGPFREYQKEFERLDDIQMFKPTNLKDATSLARMRDEQLNRLSPITQASSAGPTKNTTMKRLTWDEMQKKRA